MVEKRQPPLWLDMDFTEALARFGQTDGVEVKDAEALAVAKKAAGASIPPPDKPPVELQKRGRPRKRPV